MAPTNASKAQRDARRKAMKEKITFGLKDNEESFVEIARFRLKPDHLDKVFNMEVEYVVDEAGTVVFPENIMWHCLPAPYKYHVFEKERLNIPPDAGSDPNYDGETQVVIFNVPLEVGEEELEAWLKKGLERTDTRFVKVEEHLHELEVSLTKNQERLDNVPFMTTEATSDQGMANERKVVTKRLEEKRKEIEEDLVKARKQYERELGRRTDNPMTFKKVKEEEKRKIAAWHVTFSSPDEEDRAIACEEWLHIKLARGLKTKKHDIKPQAAFEELPEDVAEDEINMRGVVIQRMKHGEGVHTDWEWGDSYKGGFVHDIREGQGILYDKVGKYTGGFKDGYRFGHGIQIYSDGSRYEGEFGYTLHLERASLISGDEFADGFPHGKGGTMTFPDGSFYRGEFRNGVITGKGVYENPNTGEKMEGVFLEGVLHGEGVHITKSGDRYEGMFSFGQLHGVGEFVSKAKRSSTLLRPSHRYTGQWDRGEPHGKGTYEYKAGATYHGFYRDGQREGPGRMIYGNVKERFDKSTGKTHMIHDHEYQGLWIVNKFRARGYHSRVYDHHLPTEKQTAKPVGYEFESQDRLDFTTNFKSWRRIPYLHEIVSKESLKRRRRFIRNNELEKAEKLSMKAIIKQNRHAFKQERREKIRVFKLLNRKLQLFNLTEKEIAELQNDDESEWSYYDENEDGEAESDGADGESGDEEEVEDGVYCDSDWFSEDEEDDFDEQAVQSFIQNNSVYRDLKVSLVDLFEEPPPTNKMGHIGLKEALEHYLYKANAQRMKGIRRRFMS